MCIAPSNVCSAAATEVMPPTACRIPADELAMAGWAYVMDFELPSVVKSVTPTSGCTWNACPPDIAFIGYAPKCTVFIGGGLHNWGPRGIDILQTLFPIGYAPKHKVLVIKGLH